MFEKLMNVPQIMRDYNQWVVWTYEQRDSTKPTKVPRDPKTGNLASVSDPNTWSSFEEACAVHRAGNGDGIGFVFTENDPFVGIDLDVPEGQAPSEIQQFTLNKLASYAEFSPSERGAHIIVKGSVPHGRNSQELGIEIYPSSRFFTFTGNRINDLEIEDRAAMVSELWHEIGGKKDTQLGEISDPNPAPQISDEDLTAKAFTKYAEAGRWYDATWRSEGDFDWSDAFFAVLCALCEFSTDEAQVRRIVMASPLVQDAAPKGRETRAQKAERLWAKEYAKAAALGATERQERANAVAHGKQVAEALLAGSQAQNPALSKDAGWFAASSLVGKPVPPREWHVPGTIPANTVTDLTGDGGSGKSLIAMQLAVATATGTQWLGQDVRMGGAIYLTAEDDPDELHRRLAGLCPLAELDRLTLRSLAGYDALLAASHARSGILTQTPLFADLDARMGLERPALLVLDTRADLFGGDENSRAQGRQFIGMLRGLAIRHNCAVLLLSHPSVAGIQSGTGTSGTTAWSNSVRSRLYLSRVFKEGEEPNPDARVLTTKKSNYGRIGQQIHLHWHDGKFWEIDLPTLETQNVKAESVFLKLLAEIMAQGRTVNSSGGHTYAPNVFAAHPEAEGITKRAFKDAMQKLLATGRIVTVETGPPSRRRSHIELGKAVPTLFQPENGPFQPPSTPSTNPYSNPYSNPLPTGGVPPPHTP